MLSGPSSGGDCVSAAAAEPRADPQLVGGGPAPFWAAARQRSGRAPEGHDVVPSGSLCRRRVAVFGWFRCRRGSRTYGHVARRGRTRQWLRDICQGADAPSRELESSGGAGRLDCRAAFVAARSPRRVRSHELAGADAAVVRRCHFPRARGAACALGVDGGCARPWSRGVCCVAEEALGAVRWLGGCARGAGCTASVALRGLGCRRSSGRGTSVELRCRCSGRSSRWQGPDAAVASSWTRVS
ncbi:hypothetical protein BU14_0244s0004 [Porphyra umbilicalis]|uniref:Uncharacterized protein n=1 Tax=Porphyra umbilicalis TaxID=2786 RepID=A0A1X6P2U6_PORUM|nr:hypothetical protein BU14_0244s0004 [Porphyra umbilicalis]|eukprot:OSX75242.1 hypothetical protein BU14_0244s0004 [Porphyra umbilicalis]